ncbi:DUF1707 SHOCT-like domain-containing protein [Micromonospora coerulea]|uniref:DUF1707 SHOCT-like domain-containing protein n=1 Tax=Micromonospora coerulea TaxID=47856 RepID=UPI0019032B56|nr:DUF1707 domain-containing protein [Micromonospora veneta]
MTISEEPVQDLDESRPDLRVGIPEREAARKALKAHLAAERLHSTEYDQRWADCREARTQAELLRIFADPPAPHPDLPNLPGPSADTDDDISPLAVSVGVALLVGLPVTVVLGFAYGAWWTLAVPVTVSVAMVYAEHLMAMTRNRQAQEELGPNCC